MKLRPNQLLPIISIVISVGVGIWLLLSRSNNIGYFDANQVFEAFNMKKEYQEKFESTQKSRAAYLDSLRKEIMQYQQLAKKEVVELKTNEYYRLEEEFRNSDEALMMEYNQKIWKRLNQLIDDYAKEEGLDLLVGEPGTEGFVAGAQANDKTQEIIVFVNGQYQR